MFSVEIFNKIKQEWENAFSGVPVVFPTYKEAQECIDLFKAQDELHERLYPGAEFKTGYRVRRCK